MPKQRSVRVKTFSAATLTDLETAYHGWSDMRQEEDFLDWESFHDGTNYVLIVLYIA